MNVRKAIDETMILAETLTEHKHTSYELSKEHLREMYQRIQSDATMSDVKLATWLGWMQASIVSWGVADVDDMKRINKRNQ
jgi:hypothetical protein